MKALIVALISIFVTGCATMTTDDASVVLDETRICMIASSRRWWISGEWVYAGKWEEGKNSRSGYTVLARARLTYQEQQQITDALNWIRGRPVGQYDIHFENDDLNYEIITGSPSFVIDCRSSEGSWVLHAYHPVSDLKKVIAVINSALPVSAGINWDLTDAPYHLEAMPKKRPTELR